jgi:hypothetical protein
VTKRLHRYSPICQRMERRGYYVEPHAQDLSYLLAVTGPSLNAANSLPSGRKARTEARCGAGGSFVNKITL